MQDKRGKIPHAKLSHIAGICLALLVITFVVYMQARHHEFLSYDDTIYVTSNAHVKDGVTAKSIIWAFTSFDASNWHPLTWLSHMLDVELFDMNPRGHHLTSVIIHAQSTVFLFILLLRMTGSLWRSACVAALFAIHPLHIESVAWVAERKDVLSAFFCFLTLLLYAEYAANKKRLFYMLTLFSYALGLMAKPMLVSLPLLLLLLDYWPLMRVRNNDQEDIGEHQSGTWLTLRVLAGEKIPFFACAAVSSVITIFAQHSGGAVKSFDAIPLSQRIQNALVAYVAYIGDIIWPDDLAVLYPLPSSYPAWQVIGSLLILLAVSGLAIRVRDRFPFVAAGWAWYVVTLLPVIGIIQVGVQASADRYTYIPSIGIFIIVVWGVAELTIGLKQRTAILTILAAAIILAKSVATWQQLGYWRDDIPLYQRTLEITTDNYVIHNNLGSEYANNRDLDAAIREFREALRIKPDYADAHFNLGIALAVKGELDFAIRELREALRINPGNSKAKHYLDVALEQKRWQDEAQKAH